MINITLNEGRTKGNKRTTHKTKDKADVLLMQAMDIYNKTTEYELQTF